MPSYPKVLQVRERALNFSFLVILLWDPHLGVLTLEEKHVIFTSLYD
jgi:hypothetical protein